MSMVGERHKMYFWDLLHAHYPGHLPTLMKSILFLEGGKPFPGIQAELLENFGRHILQRKPWSMSPFGVPPLLFVSVDQLIVFGKNMASRNRESSIKERISSGR